MCDATGLFPPKPAAHGKLVLALILLLLLLLPWRSYGPASTHATVDVLLFFLRRFQDLKGQVSFFFSMAKRRTEGENEIAELKTDLFGGRQQTWF